MVQGDRMNIGTPPLVEENIHESEEDEHT